MAYRITTNHDEIKGWAKKYNGKPVLVANEAQVHGELYIAFEGSRAKILKELSWEAFFEMFDENHLAFAYKTEVVRGEESHSCTFLSRDKVTQEGEQ